MSHPPSKTQYQVLVVDFGSKHLLPLADMIRASGALPIVLNVTQSLSWIEASAPDAIILAGGCQSVSQHDLPEIPDEFLGFDADYATDFVAPPILAFGYAIRRLTIGLNGRVDPEEQRQSFVTRLDLFERDAHRRTILFQGLEGSIHARLDSVERIAVPPNNFRITARDPDGHIVGLENREYEVFGINFDPASPQTTSGPVIISNFIRRIGTSGEDPPSRRDLEELTGEKIPAAPRLRKTRRQWRK